MTYASGIGDRNGTVSTQQLDQIGQNTTLFPLIVHSMNQKFIAIGSQFLQCFGIDRHVCKCLPAVRHHIIHSTLGTTTQIQHQSAFPHLIHQRIQSIPIHFAMMKYVGCDNNVRRTRVQPFLCIVHIDSSTDLQPLWIRFKCLLGRLGISRSQHNDMPSRETIALIQTCKFFRWFVRREILRRCLLVAVRQRRSNNLLDLTRVQINAWSKLHPSVLTLSLL
mmetsp:Transcript_7570/g.13659  ORF Transcript_7570/g.13659 Transcript_7570/m.13659 type:complete len:221 (+) Transcript_7570:384-1046(+)